MTEMIQNPTSAALDLWLGQPAPRYTSYPPAPFFHNGVNARDYALSLGDLPLGQPVALYIHIPFCRSLCLYCGCNTMITNRLERMERYMNALHREIAMMAEIIGHRRITNLHFGGGTPNSIPSQNMRDLFACLRRHFNFESISEIAMELDPRLCSQKQAVLLKECGVTRVSLGVQDFDPKVQEVIHRMQPYEQVKQVCGWLRESDITRINFDLIYGLPRQTLQTVADTAAQACALAPDRVAVFSYAHVPQIKKHQRPLEVHGLPDINERLALDQAARAVFISHGYKPIGIDHFAKPDDPLQVAWSNGALRRNFQGYTTGNEPTLLGLGASSISQTHKGYFQSERDARKYQEVIEAGHLPQNRGFLLSPEDRVRAAIIERLMCSLSCDISEICSDLNFPAETFLPVLEELQSYEQAGIVSRKDYALCLTTPYRMAIRVICSLFDDYTHRAPSPASRTA